MHCPYCKAENPSRFSFCGYCGSPLPTRSSQSNQLHVESSLKSGNERHFAAILFADIAGFTRTAEGLDLEEVTRMINRCLEEMAKGAVKHGGKFINYIGDGLMSVFSQAATPQQNAINAAEAGIKMQQNVAHLELGPNIPAISLHVGIACGTILTIEIGTQQQREYTVIGTAVNLASQLEEISAPGQILVSDDIYKLIARDFTLHPFSPPPQICSQETQTVYELMK